jgi:adenylyltransferase/sulfurtransferase
MSSTTHQDGNNNRRYLRQELFGPIGAEGQRLLGDARIVLVGCGALGSNAADLLVRAGIGSLTLIDRDYVELHNLQRQTLFDEDDVRTHTPKAAAAAARLQEINSNVEIIPVIADLNATSAERLLGGATVILDGTDNFETRYLINDVAVKHRIPWVYGGVISSYGMTLTIRPGASPCLRCLFPEPAEPGSAPTCDTAGVIAPVVQIVSAIEVAEALKLVTGAIEKLNQALLSVDVWSLTFDRVPLPGRNPACPACGRGVFSFLDGGDTGRTTVLCGHDAVQVLIDPPVSLDLAKMADRLRPAGDVLLNRFLLRFADFATGHELTIFPDGRAIVKGTTDPVEARALYARYVGT